MKAVVEDPALKDFRRQLHSFYGKNNTPRHRCRVAARQAAASVLHRKDSSLRTRPAVTLAASIAVGLACLFVAPPAQATGEPVTVTISSMDGSNRNSTPSTAVSISAPTNTSDPTVRVDLSQHYQIMRGFGSSLDLTTIKNLAAMDSTHRTSALTALFSPTAGAGLSWARVEFGTSDFDGGVAAYSYDDLAKGATDTSLSQFSIQPDIDNGNIAIIKAALAVNPKLKLWASVWSPPGWMKNNDGLGPGNMLTQYVGVYAQYMRKAIQAYQSQGITITGVSLANEPEYCNNTYAQTCWTQSQLQQVTNNMKSEFTSAGLSTEVWYGEAGFGYYDRLFAPSMTDATTKSNTTALAFHPYEGSPSDMNRAHYATGLPVYMTEEAKDKMNGPNDVTAFLRNSASLDSWWVSIADENGGPSNGPFSFVFKGPDSEAFIQTTSATPNNFHLNYAGEFFKQFSANIHPGATRVYSDEGTSTLKTVAFRNPDGEASVVVTNSATTSQTFKLQTPTGDINATLPAQSVGTYRWYPSNLISNGGFESGFSAWTTGAGSGGAESSYPHSGTEDGYLHPSPGAPAQINQSFSAPTDGVYEISAYGAASGITALLSADVNGSSVSSTNVSGGVYSLYSLDVPAKAGDTIRIRYSAPAAASSTWATIDDVNASLAGTNLLANPSFETNTLASWTGTAGMSGTETTASNSGGYDAYAHPTSSASAGLSQTITAPSTGTYTITGYLGTNITGASFGANVGSTTVASTSVIGSTLTKYLMSFSATAGQAINVWAYAPSSTASGAWLSLDDASLSH